MKVKIKQVEFHPTVTSGIEKVFYTVEYKWHWWQRWKPLKTKNAGLPRLFESEEEIQRMFGIMGFEEK